MNRILTTALTLTTGVWLGGLLMLFLAVQSLFFNTFVDNREMAGNAASAIFRLFNQNRLGLAAAGVLLSAAYWMTDRHSRTKLVIFILLALAVVAAVGSTGFLAPRIDALRLARATHTAEFARLHGLSMIIYLIETLLVFAAAIILPNSIDRSSV